MGADPRPPAGEPCPTCGGAAPAGGDAPLTHCEWCGAEYPIPGEAQGEPA